MTITGEVMESRVESFQGKTGKVDVVLVAIIDRDTPRLINSFDWAPSVDQQEEAKSLREGSTVTLGVRDIKPAFGGRLRFTASILKGGKADQVKPAVK